MRDKVIFVAILLALASKRQWSMGTLQKEVNIVHVVPAFATAFDSRRCVGVAIWALDCNSILIMFFDFMSDGLNIRQ